MCALSERVACKEFNTGKVEDGSGVSNKSVAPAKAGA